MSPPSGDAPDAATGGDTGCPLFIRGEGASGLGCTRFLGGFIVGLGLSLYILFRAYYG